MADVPSRAEQLSERTMLLAVEMGRWGNTGKVRSGEVQADCDEAMLLMSKRLIASDEWESIKAQQMVTYSYLYKLSMPSFFKRGIYRIKTALQPVIEATLIEAYAEMEKLVEEFTYRYDALIAEAQFRLRGLHHLEDYPTAEQVRQKFYMRWTYPAEMGVSPNLAVVDPGRYEREVRENEERKAAMWEEYRALLRARMAELVDGAVAIFQPGAKGKPKSINQESVEKWQEFWGIFRAQDLTDDAELQALVKRGKALTDGLDAGQLRQGSDIRGKLSAGFAEIQDELRKLPDTPVRRISFEDEE